VQSYHSYADNYHAGYSWMIRHVLPQKDFKDNLTVMEEPKGGERGREFE
jgi:hypothetical protein